MFETRLAQDHESPRGSSNEGDSVRMEANPPRKGNLVEQVESPPVALNAQNPQVECLLNMKEMFDQLVTTLKREPLVASPIVALSRAPIDKLAQHRASTFMGTDESNLEVDEYWLEATKRILTKQLPCSDKHKLASCVHIARRTIMVNVGPKQTLASCVARMITSSRIVLGIQIGCRLRHRQMFSPHHLTEIKIRRRPILETKAKGRGKYLTQRLQHKNHEL
ncbi:hypothetical protein GQ457_01G017930 [Hibiscus cannabinus]